METKTQHYWDIHRRVTNVIWGDLPAYLKDAIVEDTGHITRHFNLFQDRVNSETERLYNDPEYHFNQRCFPDRWGIYGSLNA